MFLELNERTEIANNANADLFISIHCDGFTNPKPSGASVFVMGMSKLKANMDVAMRKMLQFIWKITTNRNTKDLIQNHLKVILFLV